MNYNINGTIYKTMPLGRAKNIAGKKFGRLTPIERVQVPEGLYAKSTYWVARCDCGNLIVTTTSSLGTGNTRSCGCLHQETARKLNYKDLTGRTFGRLTVIEQADGVSTNGSTMWRCACECGNENVTNASSLRQGLTKSCGCLANINSVKAKVNNLIGTKHHHWTVLELVEYRPNSESIYLCECVCGEQEKLRRRQLHEKKSCGCRRRGKYSHNWNPHLSEEERKLDRYTYVSGLKDWAKEIYRRAHYRCQVCGDEPRDIVAHHLNSYRGHEDEATDLDNGTCVCRHCHNSFHREYGNGYNTKEQFYEYARSKGVCMIGENVRRRNKTNTR